MKKVLVGCPVSDYHDYCLDEYISAIKNLSYSNYDILLVDNSKDKKHYLGVKKKGINVIKSEYFDDVRERIINSRNILREYALDNKYDYFFSLEQDVIPPKDVIERLLKHKKAIVGGVYYNPWTIKNEIRLLPVLWMISKKDPSKRVTIKKEFLDRGRLIKVDICGLGCVLIHKQVLKNIKFRYEDKGMDDVPFCLDAKEKGFNVYVDTSIICKHLIKGRNWKWEDLIK